MGPYGALHTQPYGALRNSKDPYIRSPEKPYGALYIGALHTYIHTELYIKSPTEPLDRALQSPTYGALRGQWMPMEPGPMELCEVLLKSTYGVPFSSLGAFKAAAAAPIHLCAAVGT